MRGFQRIDSIIPEIENSSLSTTEKTEFLLERIRKCLLEEAAHMHITFPEHASTKDIITGLNFIIFEYRPRKKFNTKLITSITTVMSAIQHSPVTFKTVQDLNLRDSPVYVYDDSVLTAIKSHNKTDNLNVVFSLIDYLNKSFAEDLFAVRKLD